MKVSPVHMYTVNRLTDGMLLYKQFQIHDSSVAVSVVYRTAKPQIGLKVRRSPHFCQIFAQHHPCCAPGRSEGGRWNAVSRVYLWALCHQVSPGMFSEHPLLQRPYLCDPRDGRTRVDANPDGNGPRRNAPKCERKTSLCSSPRRLLSGSGPRSPRQRIHLSPFWKPSFKSLRELSLQAVVRILDFSPSSASAAKRLSS